MLLSEKRLKFNRPVKVRRISDGREGWAMKYGASNTGGIRVSIMTSKQEALDTDVSCDVGDHMIARCIYSDPYHLANDTGDQWVVA